MFLKVIACEIAFREICLVAATSPNLIELEFIEQGYHDVPQLGKPVIQAQIDAVEEGKFEAILVGYGLCNNMMEGIVSRHTPLVIPRAHDCITLFLGSKERYESCFYQHPGTYYYTSGWIECKQKRGKIVNRTPSMSAPKNSSYQKWVEEFGEEGAKYLLEVMGEWREKYSHGILIDFEFTQNLNLRQRVLEICRNNSWNFKELKGDLGLLQRWVDGLWSEDEFLTVKPGQSTCATYDKRIISAE